MKLDRKRREAQIQRHALEIRIDTILGDIKKLKNERAPNLQFLLRDLRSELTFKRELLTRLHEGGQVFWTEIDKQAWTQTPYVAASGRMERR